MNGDRDSIHETSYDKWIKIVQAIPERSTDPQIVGGVDLRHLFKEHHSYSLLPVCDLADKIYVMKTHSFATEKELMEFGRKQYIIYQAWKQDPTTEGEHEYWIRSADHDIMAGN